MTIRKKRVALITSAIDNRKARGTALAARKFIEQLYKFEDRYSFVLIHEYKTNDPIYSKHDELLLPNIWLPFAKQTIKEIIFWISFRVRGREKFDIVHYLHPRVWPSYLLSNGKKIVITAYEAGVMRNLHKLSLGDLVFRFTNRFLNWRMNSIIATSMFGKKEISRYYHIPEKRIQTIELGIDPYFKPINKVEATRVAKKYNISTPFILSVARFDPHKNILRIIQAFNLVLKNGFNGNLVLVGGRHLKDYSEMVESEIKRLNLSRNIHIAPYISDEDFPAIYSVATMLAYPSLHEGFGVPIIEAMACGTPVLTSTTTATPETAGGAALLVDPTNVEDIASGMNALISDKDLREKLIQKGLERSSGMTWEKTASSIISIYDNL